MILDVTDAKRFLEKHRVMTLAGAGGEIPSLASEVAGEPVKGSWWGHPAGKRIFALSGALADDPGVLVMKLAGGKVCFVDRALFAPVFRAAVDAERVANAPITRAARSLLEAVEREHTVRPSAAQREARDELEAHALALVTQEHGERGAHVTVIRSWRDWAPQDVRREAKALGYAEATAAIRAACRGVASPLDGASSSSGAASPRRTRAAAPSRRKRARAPKRRRS